MADAKITDLTALLGANLATNDLFGVVDVSDTTMDVTGTTKKIAYSELLAAVTNTPSLITPIIVAGAAPSASQGKLFFDSTQLALGCGYGASGTPLNIWQVGVFYAQKTASTAVAASATNASLFTGATAVGTRILPVGFFVAGRTIRLSVYGTYTSSATIANNAITIKLNLVSSTPTTVQLAATPVFTVPVSQTNATFCIDVIFTCLTVGTSGTVRTQGSILWATSGTVSGSQSTQLNSTAVATINTTLTETIDITATTGTGASAVTVTNAIFEVIA